MFENENPATIIQPSAHSLQVGNTGAFLGKSGQLYIRVRRLQPTISGEEFHDQTAVYPSIEAYNARSAKPEYTTVSEIKHDFLKSVDIDKTDLQIRLPLPD